MAAVTQLFYTNNWLHDYWYDSGFNEAAGNAQLDNFGRGGVGGDPLRAEAQDGALAGSRNNANMTTPADGLSPRMQMYLWTGTATASLTVSSSARPHSTVGTAAFGPQSFDVTGPVVLADDGAGATAPTPASRSSTTSPARSPWSIAARARFAQKVGERAGWPGRVGDRDRQQPAGAPPGTGRHRALPITIGILSITQDDGTALKTALLGGPVTATMIRATGVERDGDLDDTIVAHEWGHYLHHRLVVGCGTMQCGAQSEGWGDFLSLHTMLRPTDDLGGAYRSRAVRRARQQRRLLRHPPLPLLRPTPP